MVSVCICKIRTAAAAKSLQSCPTLYDPIDGSPPGSPVPGTLQGRTLEWVAISFSNAWKWNVKGKSLSHVWLLATPWTTAYQAPLSKGFSRQEYRSGVPLPSPMAQASICYFSAPQCFCLYWVGGQYDQALTHHSRGNEMNPTLLISSQGLT